MRHIKFYMSQKLTYLTLNGVSLRGIFFGGKCQVKAKIYQVISQKGPPDTYGATFKIKIR